MKHVDAGRRIVAPSEVVAADWRRRVLLHSPRQGILESRIVPWDRFKEEVFGLKTERRPVNRAFRQLFILDLLRRHTEDPIFRRIVHPELTDGAGGMAPPLSRLLPALPQLPSSPGAKGGEADPTIRDLYRLRQEYEGFLDRYRLFEPNWLAPSGPLLTSPTSLFFPELVEDFRRFAGVLQGHPELTIVSLKGPGDPASRRYRRHSTAILELRALAQELSDLLDAGTYPPDLAVTLAGWREAYPYFRRECDLLDVPLAPRRGRALTEFPGARLFELLRQAVDSDFEVTRVEALLCDPTLPWKADLHLRRIVSLGRAGRSLGRFGPEGTAFDFWSDALRRQNAPPEMRRTLRRLFRILTDLRKAPDLTALRRLVFRLLNGYMDREAWSPEIRPALERSLELLGALSEAQAATGIDLGDPFSAWRSALAGTTYVTQAEEVAIPVYDYRVAAGILPARHFVANAHHGATRVSVDPLPGLRSDQKAHLGLEPFSMSDHFLLGYSLSGTHVTISGAEDGISGRQMTPDWFYPNQIVDPGGTGAGATSEGGLPESEGAWLSDGAALPGEIWPVEWEGLSRYAETEGAPRPGGDLSPELLSSLLGDRLYSQEGALLLSASRLSSYLACPQGYLLSYPLRLEDDDPRAIPETVTPLEEGVLSHELLRSLHEELREPGGTFDSLATLSEDELSRRMAEIVRSWGARNVPTPGALVETAGHKLVPQLRRALRWEAERFAGRRPVLVEAKLTGTPVPGVLLTGKIDLVVSGSGSPEENEELEIVDFKRSSTPAAGSLEWATLPREEIGEILDGGWDKMDVQLPVYVSLLRSEGRRIGVASFYSMKSGEDTKSAFRAEGEPPGEELLDALEALITEVSHRIARGGLGIPNRGLGCASCVFRGVCRAKFVSEERHDPPRS